MSLDDAPIGTIVQIGHKANNVTASKDKDGRWRETISRKLLDLDPRDVTDVLHLPA